jgi:hypothetical protein
MNSSHKTHVHTHILETSQGKPTKEIFIRASRSPKVTAIMHLAAREHLQTPKLSHTIYALISMPKSLYNLLQISTSKNKAKMLLYNLICMTLLQ